MAFTFPASPSVNDTHTVGSRIYTWTGTKWVLTGGIITASQIPDGTITAAKIADGTVVAAEIANDAITTAKIAAGAVTAAKLGNDISLTPADGSISTAKLAANAVTQAKLASNLTAVTVTTTANRDTDIASPFTGQLAILTDTSKVQLYNGTVWISITLAPPETPTSLSAVASTTSVAISFTLGADNGSVISNHKYALSTNGGSTYGSFIALNPVDITSPITISGLSMNTEYYVKIKTVNGIGDSVASAAVSFTTEGVANAPTSLSASSITGSTADIAFTAGAANGSAITNYKFAVSTDDITYGSFTALATPDASTPITITGLTSGTAQYIKLKAVNGNGDSAASDSVSVTTLSTPSAPTSLSAGSITTTTVNITFTAGDQGGSAITNYQYALSTNSGSTYGSFTALATPDATSPITITGLTNNTAYYIKLKAVNNAGAGAESSAVSFTTLEAVTVDYLVVAGGGGGGSGLSNYAQGAGGGAGGLRSSVTGSGGGAAAESPLSITAGATLTLSIGGGGGSVNGSNSSGGDGGSSSISGAASVSSTGGGGGGGEGVSGRSGGSGGGSSGTGHGAGSTGQGYRGGSGSGPSGKGGGGAAASGGDVNGNSSSGGDGRYVSITGSSVPYAGGGGGGNYSGNVGGGYNTTSGGGVGGGGAGGNSNAGGSGSANTGGGGGGGSRHYCCSPYSSGGGGSGLIVLLYPAAKTLTSGGGLGYSHLNQAVTINSVNYKYTRFTSGSGNITIS